MGTHGEFDQHYVELLAIATVAARRVVGRNGADDIASESMSRAWLHWEELDVLAARRWVSRVATNLAIDRLRRKAPSMPQEPFTAAIDEDFIAREAVIEAVGILPPRQREAIVLRHLGGMSQKEVAAALGVARGTAAVHIARGEAALRSHLAHAEHTTRRTTVSIESIEEAVDAMANGLVVQGTVESSGSHGLNIDIGIPAFMPERFIDIRRVEELTTFVGRTLDCTVRAVHAEKGLVSVSRMHAIESVDDQARRRAWFTGLREGARLPGVVSASVPFGWFVELSGGTGLVHVSAADGDLSVGQRLEVDVVAVDVEAERISLRPSPTTESSTPLRR
ncbi:MAG TPA: sigma-70 family RNA polymerase sigma factor [Acidimicrobiales bacterium]|nr:sigma-70 family RNA polymerase sigma factor [Acidimicrobiales bacterium]